MTSFSNCFEAASKAFFSLIFRRSTNFPSTNVFTADWTSSGRETIPLVFFSLPMCFCQSFSALHIVTMCL
ncbi:Uncharacterised protein [Chlamydia abortus]|nr:Uncharacterised protein [Chlamydia abortus]